MHTSTPDKPPAKQNWRNFFWALLILICISFALTWTSTGKLTFTSWLPSFIAAIIGGVILFVGWLLLRSEKPPTWLGMLLVSAAILRLAVGMVWFSALPILGHGTPAEQGGYVMADASDRDKAAWDLARSGKPLWTAFRNNRTVDQYGGMLFLSAMFYRYMGGPDHLPLSMVVICAAFSALAVPLTWAFTRYAWGAQPAKIAAWILAFYPEAVLLGSSQMREAFTITLTTAAFFGLFRLQKKRKWSSLAWIAIPLLFYLPFSAPFASLLLGMLVLVAVSMNGGRFKQILHQRRLWIVFVLLTILILVGLWLALKQFVPEDMNNPLAMLSWWLRKSAKLQTYLSRHASGWIQKVFKSTPEWLNLPLLVTYGVVQPFLPAAIIAGSQSPVWHWIAIWRATGWALMLAMLCYAPICALRNKSTQGFTKILILVIWLVILIASFRGGGDQWDNPRYRATFAGVQAGLVAWALIEQRRMPDPWLRRALFSAGAIVGWFLPWYLRRYAPVEWPIADLFKTVGLGIACAFLISLWDWARTSKAESP